MWQFKSFGYEILFHDNLYVPTISIHCVQEIMILNIVSMGNLFLSYGKP